MIKKIIIFGGGTSGYLSAAFLRNNVPAQVEIQLIESSKVGIIGVGEGTQPYTAQFLRQCGIGPGDWMKPANASYKLGVEFNGWHDDSYFVDNDTFATFVLGPNLFTYNYWASKDKKDFFDSVPSYRMAKANKSPKLKSNMDFNHGYQTETWDAVHFDAYKIGETLKDIVKDRIEIIDTEIIEVDANDGNIICMRDDNGIEYSADLYIDCSGFKSLLLEKTLEVNWLDEGGNLLCNKAVAIPTQYTNPQEECHPYTKATTMKNGWRWTIPTYERIGNGYVYSDKYCTPEEAEAELRETIGEHEAEARHLDMRIGTHDGVAHGNVVAVGLAAGFVEPLEATGITFTTKTLEFLLESLMKSDGNWMPQNLHLINTKFLNMFYEIRDFIFLHYKLSNRDDTQFWKDARSLEYPDTLQERIKSFLPSPPNVLFDENKFSMFHSGQWFEMLMGNSFYNESVGLLPTEYNSYTKMFVDIEKYRIDKVLEDWPNHYDYLTEYYKKV